MIPFHQQIKFFSHFALHKTFLIGASTLVSVDLCIEINLQISVSFKAKNTKSTQIEQRFICVSFLRDKNNKFFDFTLEFVANRFAQGKAQDWHGLARVLAG